MKFPKEYAKKIGVDGGIFVVPFEAHRGGSWSKSKLLCIASNGMDWEHVSVSLKTRCPKWEEMCFIKGIFWDAEDVVMQLHPAKSQYVNMHPFCLHLWRPLQLVIPTPPKGLVGF